MSNKRESLTLEQAIEMLPDKEYIHTFINPLNPFSTLVGAGAKREEIINDIKKYGSELTGEVATSMNHGMAYHNRERWIFVETKQKAGGPSD